MVNFGAVSSVVSELIKCKALRVRATQPFIFTRGFPPSFHYDPLYPPRNGREYFIRYGTENVGYL